MKIAINYELVIKQWNSLIWDERKSSNPWKVKGLDIWRRPPVAQFVIVIVIVMSLVWKSSKKTIKFQVEFHLEELTSVPFLAGVIFAKLRLLAGGNFRKISDRYNLVNYQCPHCPHCCHPPICFREEIVEHRVVFNSNFQFECKLTATLSTGTLDPCTVRVSVRRVIFRQKLPFS